MAQHPNLDEALSNENDTGKLKEIPPIRDNPQMAETTARRRSSVANPHSITYSDPAISAEETTSDEEDDIDEQEDSPTHRQLNASHYHDNDPSISDLQDIKPPRHAENYQPIHQLPDEDEEEEDEEEEEEDGDPFARLGNKQHSVAHPVISHFQQQQRLNQIQQNRLHQQQHYNSNPNPNHNNNANNPYTPEAILDARHLQRHNRASSKHSRSHTLAPSFMNRNRNNPQQQARPRGNSRRHQSSSVDWSDQMLGPPAGPDLTFVCMRIENRTVLQDLLSMESYTELMNIFKQIMDGAMKQFRGYCIEHNNGHVYDVLTVFNDVYEAIRCAINIQKELNNYRWPPYYYQIEQQSSRMTYVGKGHKDAFRGLRVGMGLHTATVAQDINPYDNGRETLNVQTIIFDATYEGSAVELCKQICLKSYGGELLASKAVSEALLRSKKGGDEISVQRLGICDFLGLRRVELIELIPRDLPHRTFPPRSFVKQTRKSIMTDILNNDAQEAETPNYDPFPTGTHGMDGIQEDDEEEDDDEDEDDDNYDTTNEIKSDEDESSDMNDDDDNMDNISHSSNDHPIQHNPRISNPHRRPSITQFTMGPTTQIAVSFDHPDNGEQDEEQQEHDPLSQGVVSFDMEVSAINHPNNLLSVDTYHSLDNDMQSDHSIDPPKMHRSRSKKAEIDDYRRKSQANDMMPDVMELRENLPPPNSYKKTQQEKKRRKNRKKNGQKKKKRFHRSGRDGDDENSPLPEDSDYEESKLISKPKPPRVNKQREYKATMMNNLDFDPYMDDSSVISAGSRSIGTSRTGKSSKLLNPGHQLKLYKMRPPNLPVDYSDDKDFTCLCCQSIKQWIDGVWRVPMWPSFDICFECGNKELQTGTSKKEVPNFDPTGIISQFSTDKVSTFGNLPPSHRKIPSSQPILQKYSDDGTRGVQEGHRMNQSALEMLRKELSEIIEMLTNDKLQRWDNLSSWSAKDQEMEEFRQKTIAEHKSTEDELDTWRKKANRLDEQDQRVLRRKNTVNLESPNASDLESDEELHNNWQDYDYQDDFAVIHSRLKDLDQLFWTEDQFFRKVVENINLENNNRIKELQQQYAETTMSLQQSNEQLQRQVDKMMKSENGSYKAKGNYNNLLNNDDDIDEYSSDDLQNDQMAKYEKYEPIRSKHIHEKSRQLPDMDISELKERDFEKMRDAYDEDEDVVDDNDNNNNQENENQIQQTTEIVRRLQEKVREQNSTIDNYISTMNLKDRQLKQSRNQNEELQQKINYLQNINDSEETVAELYNQLQRANEENVELQSKLKHYMFDEPSQRQSQSENEDSHSNIIFDDFAEQKDMVQEQPDDANNNGEKVDLQTFKDNELRLKAARLKIDNLETEIEDVRDENDRLTKTKMDLVNKTSQQLEQMRDELQNMCLQLQQKDQTIKQLAQMNKEGYIPETEEKSDASPRLSWTNPLGIRNPLKNGGSLMTFGRSIFSTPVHTITETKKSKIDLVISSSKEIERLRSIIRILSSQQTTKGTTNRQRNGLVDGGYPGQGY